jgi:hypothetical protein
MADAPSQPVGAPPCERCGVTTYPTTRQMRTHGLEAGKAIPHDKVVDVWRCPACGREMPRA